MSVGEGYDGSKVEPIVRDGRIRVTAEWLQEHADRSSGNEAKLQSEVVSQSICPKTWTFNDNLAVRQILGLKADRYAYVLFIEIAEDDEAVREYVLVSDDETSPMTVGSRSCQSFPYEVGAWEGWPDGVHGYAEELSKEHGGCPIEYESRLFSEE